MIGYLRDRRARRDTAIAALIVAIVAAVGAVIYLKSDARATTLATGPQANAPLAMTLAPSSLAQIWQLDAGSRFAPVISPYGTVVTADDHTVTAFDYLSGAPRWSYGRSNVALCALGSGDTKADDLKSTSKIRGVLVAYSKGDHCSEISLLNPITGERDRQRTGATAADSTLVFGGPYGGLVSKDLVELWRYDLVRTIQYGNQPTPTSPNTKHLGCTFDDIAVGDTQFATIEHCDSTGPNAQLVINYDDPDNSVEGKEKKWDALKFAPRATIDLGSTSARLLSVTTEKVAVLVSQPTPAVVVYTNPATETATSASTSTPSESVVSSTAAVLQSRTEIPVSAEAIDALQANGPVSPMTFGDQVRYVLIGDTLLAVGGADLGVKWYLSGVLGTPAVIGQQLLIPRVDSLAVATISDGAITATIPVDRAGYTGRVDVGSIGSVVVETRGSAVVGLRSPDAPAQDATVGETVTGVGGTIRLPGTG